MTQHQLTLPRGVDFPQIHRFSVGFDNLFDELLRTTVQQQSNNANYPPYNIIKHSEDKFSIELAVAGFTEKELDVTLEKNILSIRGSKPAPDTEGHDYKDYLHHGISSRDFVRTFTLAEYVEIIEAKIANGILTVELERQIPEAAKPKTIQISSI